MKVLLGCIVSILLVFSTTKAHAADGGPQFKCQNKVVVQYSPGPRWSELENVISEHLNFMAAEMRAGVIEMSGPLVSATGEPTGALAIYNSDDVKQVETLNQADPLIAKGVSISSVKAWVQCVVE